MKVSVFCPECERYLAVSEVRRTPWPCPQCGTTLTPTPADTDPAASPATLTHCQHCGNEELYTQKDFPHAIGFGILLVAVVASFIAYGFHQIALTWAILLGSAAVDGLLYYFVGNVTVCYRCLAQHRGFANTFPGFELAIGEKYRQERLRRQQATAVGGPKP